MRTTVHQFRGLVQSAGTLFRARSEDVLAEFDRRGASYDLFMRYLHALLDQLAQTAVCNRLHHVEERLARWLLIVHDYAGADEIPMTHEFIAMMLGIDDRDRQTASSARCECYAAVRGELDRSLRIVR